MKTTLLKIDGMGCSGCVNTVENALSSLPGVKAAVVDLGKETAEIDYDENEVKESDFRQAVKDAGYQIKS